MKNNDHNAFTDLKPAVLNTPERPQNFRSLRWKLVLPLLVITVIVAMLTTYVITDAVARGVRDSQINQLLIGARAVSERAAALGTTQQREANRIAFTQHVADLVVVGNGPILQTVIQPLAAASDLDYVLVSGANGHEIVGVQRVGGNYRASQGAFLDKLGFLQPILSGIQSSASGIVRVENGYGLFTAAPIRQENRIVGVAVVGIRLERVLQTLRESSLAEMALYGPDGELLRTTFTTINADAVDANEAVLALLKLDSETRDMALTGDNRVPVRAVQIGQTPYQVAYIPLIVDSTVLGVVGVLQVNNLWYATDLSRQLLSLCLSGLAAVIVITSFSTVSLALRRLSRVTRTAQALAWGDPYARTLMEPTDEIGEIGYALDRYANRIQKRQASLELSLRNQRRETARLTSVLDSIPDGIIVQDLDGRVVLINDRAFRLLGSQRVFRSSLLNELTAIVTDRLGAALAPGIYSLGDPQRVPLDGKILHAQAAAVLSMLEKRIGTVIVLRDITEEVRRDQAREAVLEKISREVRTPAIDPALKGKSDEVLQGFIREVNRNAITLQRMIAEIRDLSMTDSASLQRGQQALSTETLIWNIAQEWQPNVTVAELELHVVVLRRGLLVLGEERRLRWAIGNLLDNAIKYTPSTGHITLMLKTTEDDQQALVSIQDTGVGISPSDLPHVFTRFYRGHPVSLDGKELHTTGSGQGLFIAKRVIEAHGGTIKLRSAVGQGTEVIFTLPLTADVTLDFSDEPSESASALEPPNDDQWQDVER
ncbi:MAG: ATP-binding protein [Chloroflexota bacterium]